MGPAIKKSGLGIDLRIYNQLFYLFLSQGPDFDKRGLVGDLPSYTGFHCDVFQAIKEHYHSISNEPLIPCHLTSLLEECMGKNRVKDVTSQRCLRDLISN